MKRSAVEAVCILVGRGSDDGGLPEVLPDHGDGPSVDQVDGLIGENPPRLVEENTREGELL